MKSLFTFLAALLMPVFLFAAAPVISDTAATVQIGKKAQVTGRVAGDGTNVTVTVHYGLTTAYGATKVVELPTVTAATSFTAQLADLTEGATYNYKVVAKNPTDPEVETANATFVVAPVISGVTATPEPGAKVTIAGSVATGGFATTASVAYGKTTSYGASRTFTVAAGGTFSGQLTGLEFGTLYHYKVTAKNTGGDGVSTADATFTTVAAADPEVKNDVVANFTADATGNVTARLTAAVSGNGHNATVDVLFGATSPPTQKFPSQSVSMHDVDKTVTFPLTNLEIGKTYYYLITVTKVGETVPVPGAVEKPFVVPALNPIFLGFRSNGASVQQVVNITSATTAEITVLVDPLGKDAEVTAEFGVAVTTTVPPPAPVYDRSVSGEASPDAPAVLPAGVRRADLKTKLLLTGLARGTYNYRINATNGTTLPRADGTVQTSNLQFSIPGEVGLTASHKLNGDSATITAVVSAQGEAVDIVFTLTPVGSGEPVVVRRDAAVPDNAVKQPVDVIFGDLAPGTAYTYAVSAGHRGDATPTMRSGAFRTETDFTEALTGVNSGLIKDAEGNIAGGFKILGAKGGKFTARVNLGGKSHVVSGELDAEGQFRTTMDGVFFAVEASPAGGVVGAPTQLDLTVVRGEKTYTADVTVNAVTPARMKELAGLYTLAIAAPGGTAVEGESASGLPGGAGYIRMSVKEWGGVSVKGVLGDGSKFSYASTLAGTDAASGVPLWLSPKDARVSGTVTLVGEEDVTATGELKWYRQPDKGAKRFEEGFFTSVNAVGGPYVPPTGRQRILNADTSDVTITFSGGDLLSNIVVNGTIDSRNRILFPKGALKNMKVDSENGVVTGSVEHSRTGKDVKYVAAIVNGKATGSFGGTTTTGTVSIAPGRTVQPAPQPQPQPQPDPDDNGNPGIDLGGLGR